MKAGTWLRTLLWGGLTGGVVGLATFLVLDWVTPGRISIVPAPPASIVVVIDGAVATPGTLALAGGARLQDAVDAAGGLTPGADVTSLNLAGRVGDGEHISIPYQPQQRPGQDTGATPVDASGSGLIDLNTASAADLEQLPGVGPVIAQRIIEFRELTGGIDSVEQLDEVEGISPAMVEEMRPLVTGGG